MVRKKAKKRGVEDCTADEEPKKQNCPRAERAPVFRRWYQKYANVSPPLETFNCLYNCSSMSSQGNWKLERTFLYPFKLTVRAGFMYSDI